MKKPVARPTKPAEAAASSDTPKPPRAFAASEAAQPIETFVDEPPATDAELAAPPRRPGYLWRILGATAGILVSLAVALFADSLIDRLFARYEWLGWGALVVVGVFLLAALIIVAREIAAVSRLRGLTALRRRARTILETNKVDDARRLVGELQGIYSGRAELARARTRLDNDHKLLLDGTDIVHVAERTLMTPLDARARALTSAAARRVAIVTAISPRALVDLAFVTYESFKLARNIADLYGARPGIFGSWRLAGEILGHLAVTGGVALGDSVVQQLVGHGLAARLSARLGEGLVNGLMTVRVGIAATRVTRPLPFSARKQPVVMDFMGDLAKVTAGRTPKKDA